MPEGKQISAIGLAWYKRADYRRILEVMADADKLPLTFDKWQSQAEDLERGLKARGTIAIRAEINPDDFVAWCAENDLDVDAAARKRWAAEVAHRALTEQQN